MDINGLKIKTYVEDEYKMAYAKARKELGPNLVIIDKKEVKEGGIFGLFGKKKVKVTFGIEKVKNNRIEQEKELITTLRDVAKKHMNQMEAEGTKEKAEESSFRPLFEKVKEEKNELKGIYTPFNKEEKKSIEDIQKELNLNPLKEEKEPEESDIEALKKELEKELKKKTEENRREVRKPSASNSDLVEKLRDNDIPKEIAFEIDEYFDEYGYDKEDFQEGLKSYFKKHIRVKHENDTKKFVMLIGPTGVGKTTTCAKIVANNWRNEKEVGFITADTYRLEAVSQLKAYANIMRVPIEVVKKPEELQTVIEKFRNKDLVLMDTAGRSPKNKEQMEELKSYVESKGDNMETILVLSATSKLSVMYETIEKFEQIGFDSIIITKLDETSSATSLLTIMKKYNYPIYYITNGQSVPDDIELCTEEMLTEIFIKGIK
jgi:flagellar biosynthesis protein FlhF